MREDTGRPIQPPASNRFLGKESTGVYYHTIEYDKFPDGTIYSAKIKHAALNADGLVLFESIVCADGEVVRLGDVPGSLGDISDDSEGGYGKVLLTQLGTEATAGKIKLSSLTVYDDNYDPSKKNKIFTGDSPTPTPPYHIGDFWVATSGLLKRCTTTRETGLYNAGDWTTVKVDDLTDNQYCKVRSVDINGEGGHIKIFSDTYFYGKWYDSDSIEIEVGVGVTIQGEGDFTCKNNYGEGYLYIDGSNGNTGLMSATASKRVVLSAADGIQFNNPIVCSPVTHLDIGDATYYFGDVYADDFVNCCKFFSFDDLDDASLISKIKSKVVDGVKVMDASSLPSVMRVKKSDTMDKYRVSIPKQIGAIRAHLQELLSNTPEDRPAKRAKIIKQLEEFEGAEERSLQAYSQQLVEDSEGYLNAVSFAGTISLLLGAVKQLNARVLKLEGG